VRDLIRLSRGVVGMAIMVLAASVAAAQTTTTSEVRAFEVVSVSGNTLVVKEAGGTREYTVPDDFRFDIGGKQVPVSALTPGMSGKATFTTRTTYKPVHVTEVKQAEVIQASANSLLVRGADGFHMYAIGDVEKRGITIMRDGKPVEFSDLRKGDRLSATIVTEGPPRAITSTEVEAVLSNAANAVSGAADAAKTAAANAATAATSAATSAAASAGAAASESAQRAATATEEAAGGRSLPLIILAIAVIGLGLYLAMRPQRGPRH
jgi:trimeric autotransporter adhesin